MIRLALVTTLFVSGFAATLAAGSPVAAQETDLRAPRPGAVFKPYALPDLLAERFPADVRRLAGLVQAQQGSGPPLSAEARQRLTVRVLSEIQSRERERIRTAPEASLVAVIEIVRAQARQAASEDPAHCAWMLGSSVKSAPSRAIADLTTARMVAVLTALADGRDWPVTAREATDSDYDTFLERARAQGIDTSPWALLTPEKALAAPPAAVCAAYLSWLDALLDGAPPLREKILATEVGDLLITDPATWEPLFAR